MKRLALAATLLGLMAIVPAQAQTVVKYLNIDNIPASVAIMQQAANDYMAAHPEVKIELPETQVSK